MKDLKILNQQFTEKKILKKWSGAKKNKLISDFNPKWETLNHQVV